MSLWPRLLLQLLLRMLLLRLWFRWLMLGLRLRYLLLLLRLMWWRLYELGFGRLYLRLLRLLLMNFILR